MYSGHGSKPEPKQEAANGQNGQDPSSQGQISQVVTLRTLEIPEVAHHLQGFRSLQSAEHGRESLEHLNPLPFQEDFSPLALKVRTVIEKFLKEGVVGKDYIGFYSESQKASGAATPGAKEAEDLMRELSSLETHLEYRLISPPKSEFLQEVVPHIHEHLGEIMQTLRSAWNGEKIRGDIIEPLAYQLLDFAALLTSAALESQAREYAEAVQSGLHVRKTGKDRSGRMLVTDNDQALQTELARQVELQQTVLPGVQSSVGSVVQQLIPFLSDLRGLEPAPFGFSMIEPSGNEPPNPKVMVEALETGIDSLEEIFSSLDEQTPMDINYRSYVHGLGHHMMALRIAFLRQHTGGTMNRTSVPIVMSQCEDTLRKLTSAIKQLTVVAHADLAQSDEQEAGEAA